MTLVKVLLDEDTDISNLDIYLDSDANKFKHKFACPTCGIVTAGCICYDSLEAAIDDSSTEWFCNRHYIAECWYDMELGELIDQKFSLGFMIVVNRFECLKDGLIFPNATNEFRDGKMDECLAECNAMIMALTEEQAGEIVRELDGDMDTEGMACEV